MAISAYSVWEVQQAGNDNNSGAFDINATMTSTLSSSTGTSTAPRVTASNYSFTSNDVGHYLFIKSGSGWYPGWYKILSAIGGSAIVQATIYQSVSSNSTISNLNGVASSNSVSSGTWAIDYTQKAGSFITYSDLYAVSGTTLSSTGQSFLPSVIGNIINVTGGAGFNTGRYTINSLTGFVASLDRTVATIGSTSGAGILGGAMASVQNCLQSQYSHSSANQWTKTFIKNDNIYNISSNISFVSPYYVTLIGYGSVRGDNTRARYNFTADNLTFFAPITQVTQKLTAMNLSFEGNSFTSSTYAFSYVQFSGIKQYAYNCEFKRLRFPTNTYGVSWQWHKCLFDGLTGISLDSAQSLYDCLTQNCNNPQWWGGPIINCVFRNNGGVCVYYNTGLHFNMIRGNTFYNNATPILHYNNCGSNQIANSMIENNLFVNNSGYAIQGVNQGDCGEFPTAIIENNAFYNNTSGSINLGSKSYQDTSDYYANNIFLSANPFLSPTTGDLRLNDVVGGGKALKGRGMPSVYNGLETTINAIDIGAIQTASTSPDRMLASTSKSTTINANTTSYSEYVYMSSTGYSSTTTDLKAYYIRQNSAPVAIGLTAQTPTGSFISGGFCEVDSINLPGLYRFDVPNAVFTSGSNSSMIHLANLSNNDKTMITYKFNDTQTLDLTQSIPLSNTPNTTGDALNASRALGFGKWVVTGTSLNLYAPDGTTIIRSFTLNSATEPTSRT
jgi:hypothetical protein